MRVAEVPRAGRAAYPAALILGGLLALAFPEPDVTPLVFLAPAGFLFLLHGAGGRRGFWLGMLFGVGFFSVLIYWIAIIGYLALVVLVLLQSLFIGAFGSAWGSVSRQGDGALYRVAVPVAGWVTVEFARGTFPLNGFTWGQLSQAVHDSPWLLRYAGVGGSWLLAGVIIAVASLLVVVLERVGEKGAKSALAPAAAALLLLAFPLLIPRNSAAGERVKAAIVQGNVPRDMDPGLEKELTILRSHVDLTEDLPGDIDLVVWPESAVGIDPEREPSVAEQIVGAAREAEAPMIVGSNLDLPESRYRVVTLLVSEEGDLVDRYQKTHLVPFGEYVPARRFLDWIPALDQVPRDAIPARERVVFDLPFGPVAPVISFEGDFGSLVRTRIAAGGRLLVVATNTSTWEESWASSQHVAMSKVRAAENGVYVLHGALSGISAVITPEGKVVSETDLWEATTLIEEVRLARSITLYARMGDLFAYLCIGGTVLLMSVRLRRRRLGTVT